MQRLAVGWDQNFRLHPADQFLQFGAARVFRVPDLAWLPAEPESQGVKFRAALEALAYLIALGVRAHEQAGQQITRITVSGGIARSALMCEILATVLNKPLQRLQSTCWDQTVKIARADPDFLRRDLFEAIDTGDFPQWELGIQILCAACYASARASNLRSPLTPKRAGL